MFISFTPAKQAPRVLTAMHMALEHLVVCTQTPRCYWVFAWWPLIQNWATLRFPRSVTPDTSGRWQTVLVRGYLEGIRRLAKGDYYIGRNSKQRPHAERLRKPPTRCRFTVVYRLYAGTHEELRAKVWSLAGCWLVCHCTPEQECHADIIIAEHRRQFPDAHDRDSHDSQVPSSTVLNLLSRLREDPDS